MKILTNRATHINPSILGLLFVFSSLSKNYLRSVRSLQEKGDRYNVYVLFLRLIDPLKELEFGK